MPNGGPDCCNDCLFLRGDDRVQELSDGNRLVPVGRCLLRKVVVESPYETFCANFIHWQRREAKGSMQGISFVHYPKRLPWHGNIKPTLCSPARCCVCENEAARGMQVTEDKETYQFCSEYHYIQWWNEAHPDEGGNFDPEFYATEFPE